MSANLMVSAHLSYSLGEQPTVCVRRPLPTSKPSGLTIAM
jgi:hypothetical protein